MVILSYYMYMYLLHNNTNQCLQRTFKGGCARFSRPPFPPFCPHTSAFALQRGLRPSLSLLASDDPRMASFPMYWHVCRRPRKMARPPSHFWGRATDAEDDVPTPLLWPHASVGRGGPRPIAWNRPSDAKGRGLASIVWDRVPGALPLGACF